MGRTVLLGGGTYEEMDDFCRLGAKMTGKELPNALFIGTALQDSTNPLTSFKKSFKRACPGAQVKKLSIIRSVYTEEEMDALLAWADVIFVGGGNTAYMLDEWKKAGLDRKLKTIYEEDRAVIMGVSAGAICWFKRGYTDSEAFEGNENWNYRWIEPKTGVYDFCFCPHYNDPKRAGFDEEVKMQDLPGIALSDCTAMVENAGEIRFYSVSEAQTAFSFRPEKQTVSEPLSTILN